MYDDDDYVDFDEYKNMQAAINAGYCWSMEGSVGRAMMGAIEAGYCMLGKERARDYYGNTIPSRKDVKAGTKGSYRYVKDRMGKSWADRLNRLKETTPRLY